MYRTNRSQAQVATAGFSGLSTLCDLCVRPSGEVNERYSRLSHVCMSNEVRQGAQCMTCGERLEEKTESPALQMERFYSCSGNHIALHVIWYKQAHKASQQSGSVQRSPLRGRWGDWLPDGVVSQTVLIKIWWMAPLGGKRIPRLHSKSIRKKSDNISYTIAKQLGRLKQGCDPWKAVAQVDER